MRTSDSDQRCWIVLIMVPLLSFLLPVGTLMADVPSLTIDLSFEREQEYFPGDWDITDTYTQTYKVDWSEQFSSRLEVRTTFELEMEDIIRSQDIDEKTLEPVFELELLNPVWEIDFLAKDTIDYSNEFNTPRKDAREFALEFNFEPLQVLPPLRTKTQRLVDTQGSLEDRVEDKFEASTDYSFGENLDIDMSWKEETTDDRLFEDSDVQSRDWDVNMDYSRALSSRLKLDIQSGLTSKSEETLNNAGVILYVDKEKEFEGEMKLTLEAFPEVTTEIEYTTTREMVEERDENVVSWSAEAIQKIMDLGELVENVDIEKTTITGPAEQTDEDNIDFSVELAGTPYRYTDYSIKYDLSVEKLDDDLDAANDKDITENEFNLSLTLTPHEKMVFDTSYNWTHKKDEAQGTESTRELKIEGTFDGELFNVPNLVFTPLLEITREKDLGTTEESKVYNIETELIYTINFSQNLVWMLETTYKWKKDDGILTREQDLGSEVGIIYLSPGWEFDFQIESSTTVYYDEPDPTAWEHEYRVAAGRELTPRITFDVEYTYTFEGDDQNTDELEANLEWLGESSSLSVKTTNDRVFEGPNEVERTYLAEFSMTF